MAHGLQHFKTTPAGIAPHNALNTKASETSLPPERVIIRFVRSRR
jgi:hypothetical protein